jgi:hypothetical protein
MLGVLDDGCSALAKAAFLGLRGFGIDAGLRHAERSRRRERCGQRVQYRITED